MSNLKFLNDILNLVESIDIQYSSTPGRFSEKIKDMNEKAHQRAILFNKITELFDSKIIINWYDIELPVEFNSNPRRQSIDLIGGNDEYFAICELKYNNTKDTPLDAVKEILGYYRHILMNYNELDKNNIHHKNEICDQNWKWSDINNKSNLIIVAANKKYWEYWKKTKKIDFNSQYVEIKNWSFMLGVEILLYQTSDEDYNEQRLRNGGGIYSPILKNESKWIQITP